MKRDALFSRSHHMGGTLAYHVISTIVKICTLDYERAKEGPWSPGIEENVIELYLEA